MKLSLVVRSPGKMEGQAIAVRGPQFLIGRDPQCQLRPSSNLISNRHCALLTRDDKVFIRDLVSTNGTFVNGQKIEAEVELEDEDQITVGPLQFSVLLEQSVPVPVPVGAGPRSHSEVEDEAATLLLGIGDEESAVAKSEAPTSTEIPTGTTVLNIPTPAAGTNPEEGKEAQSKLEQVKQSQADTSSAASAILNKYLRRR
jgi:pSer/pThr/pTyr-binding forkhead associated (FHA) protein